MRGLWEYAEDGAANSLGVRTGHRVGQMGGGRVEKAFWEGEHLNWVLRHEGQIYRVKMGRRTFQPERTACVKALGYEETGPIWKFAVPRTQAMLWGVSQRRRGWPGEWSLKSLFSEKFGLHFVGKSLRKRETFPDLQNL